MPIHYEGRIITFVEAAGVVNTRFLVAATWSGPLKLLSSSPTPGPACYVQRDLPVRPAVGPPPKSLASRHVR